VGAITDSSSDKNTATRNRCPILFGHRTVFEWRSRRDHLFEAADQVTEKPVSGPSAPAGGNKKSPRSSRAKRQPDREASDGPMPSIYGGRGLASFFNHVVNRQAERPKANFAPVATTSANRAEPTFCGRPTVVPSLVLRLAQDQWLGVP